MFFKREGKGPPPSPFLKMTHTNVTKHSSTVLRNICHVYFYKLLPSKAKRI